MLQMPTYPCGMCRINRCFVQLVFAKHIAFLSPCSLLCVINAIDWELDLWFLLFAAYSGLCPMTKDNESTAGGFNGSKSKLFGHLRQLLSASVNKSEYLLNLQVC